VNVSTCDLTASIASRFGAPGNASYSGQEWMGLRYS
jgi:hypothetical protein